MERPFWWIGLAACVVYVLGGQFALGGATDHRAKATSAQERLVRILTTNLASRV
jgi:hypothetical protein